MGPQLNASDRHVCLSRLTLIFAQCFPLHTDITSASYITCINNQLTVTDRQAGRKKLTKKRQMMDRQSDRQEGRKAETNTKKDRKDRQSDRQIGRQAET